MPPIADVQEEELEAIDGLCIAERRQKWAREGDFESLWQVLLDHEWGTINQAECFRLLPQVVEVAARKDPRKFSSEIFAKILGFSSYLLLRSHFQLRSLLDRHDAGMRDVGNLPVPREIVEAMPSLIQLQEHIAAMAETQTRTHRMWKLAGKAQRDNSDAKNPGGGKPSG